MNIEFSPFPKVIDCGLRRVRADYGSFDEISSTFAAADDGRMPREGGSRRRDFAGQGGGSDGRLGDDEPGRRSEEHTSELQSLMRISYAVFCLKNKTNKHRNNIT